MARPRGFEGRKAARFHQISDEITDIFLARGVLKRGAALDCSSYKTQTIGRRLTQLIRYENLDCA